MYWMLLLAVVGLQIGANTAHGPYQGVIPDLVPHKARGRASGFFGLANLVGTLLGAAVASVFLASGHVMPAILTIVAVLLATSLASWVFVAEPIPTESEPFPGIGTEVRRRVGLGFQEPDDMLFSTTLRDDVAFGPLQLGLGEEEVLAEPVLLEGMP